MRTTTLLTTLVAAATATAAIGAGSASAETQVRDDAVGDTTTASARVASPTSSVDIVRLTGRHAGGRLTFTFDVVDLTDDDYSRATARFLTPTGRDYRLSVTRTPDTRFTSLVRADGGLQEIECAGARGRFFDGRERVVVSVPRGCVAKPRSVRFGGTTFSGFPGPGRAVGVAPVVDDARRVGTVGEQARLGTRELRRN